MAPKSATKKLGSTSQKCGLTLPVARIEGAIRRGKFSEQTGKSSAIALTAVLEHVMTSLLGAARDVAKEHKKKFITNRHIQLAAQKDQRLARLLSKFVLLDGGVLPDVNPVEQDKKRKRAARPRKVVSEAPIVTRVIPKIAKPAKKDKSAKKVRDK